MEASDHDEAELERTGGLTCCELVIFPVLQLWRSSSTIGFGCPVEESPEIAVAARSSSSTIVMVVPDQRPLGHTGADKI